MTNIGQDPQTRDIHAMQIAHEAVDQLDVNSLRGAKQVFDRFVGALVDPENDVLKRIMAQRLMSLPEMDLLANAATVLSTDPSKSGVRVERYRLQDGALPSDVSEEIAEPDQIINLWTAQESSIAKLSCPEEYSQQLMEVAHRLGMFGEVSDMYCREEAGRVRLTDASWLHIVGGANRANIERLTTAHAVLASHDYPKVPLIATVKPTRTIKSGKDGRQGEKEKVQSFAPEAKNEFDLMIASAIYEGYEPDDSNRFGNKFLPDGASYITMTHARQGTQLIILCPAIEPGRTGLHNAYATLSNHGSDIISGFSLQGSDVVQVTSTHYAALGVLNNLEAVTALNLKLDSIQTIGDNQSLEKRPPKAHLIEIGNVFSKIQKLLILYPELRTALLQD